MIRGRRRGGSWWGRRRRVKTDSGLNQRTASTDRKKQKWHVNEEEVRKIVVGLGTDLSLRIHRMQTLWKDEEEGWKDEEGLRG